MPGKHTKGTNDADGNGKKGGSLPEDKPVVEAPEDAKPAAKADAPTLEGLQKQLDGMKDLMRRNGWSV